MAYKPAKSRKSTAVAKPPISQTPERKDVLSCSSWRFRLLGPIRSHLNIALANLGARRRPVAFHPDHEQCRPNALPLTCGRTVSSRRAMSEKRPHCPNHGRQVQRLLGDPISITHGPNQWRLGPDDLQGVDGSSSRTRPITPCPSASNSVSRPPLVSQQTRERVPETSKS